MRQTRLLPRNFDCSTATRINHARPRSANGEWSSESSDLHQSERRRQTTVERNACLQEVNHGRSFYSHFKLETTRSSWGQQPCCLLRLIMGATLSCPLFSTRAFWSPRRRAATTKYGPVEQSSPLSLSALAAADHHARTHATCPQSRQSWRLSRTRTRNPLPWLPQTSTPRRQASFSIILEAGLRLSDVVFICGIKGMLAEERAGLRSSAVSVLRWRMLCLGFLMPSWTRAPAPSAFTVCALRWGARCSFWMICQKRWWKHNCESDGNDAASVETTLTRPYPAFLFCFAFLSRLLFFFMESRW